jgi:methylphosphotriester-DNA--protein-cysteine methyltransferase
MLFQTHVPPAPLADFVALLWSFQGRAVPHNKERLLPMGTTELIFNLHENQTRVFAADSTASRELPGSVVSGPHSECFVIDTQEQQSVIGVHFKPGGARPFFAMPATEFHNTHVALADVWGPAADRVRDQLRSASSTRARFRILEQALLARLNSNVRHPAVEFALRQLSSTDSAQSVADVTARLGFSARHFIQLFSAEVGLTPKLFARVRRFQDVVRHVHQQPEVDWADVAVACGYYDQAHFINDFRGFSGLTPRDYLARRTAHMNHVPIG